MADLDVIGQKNLIDLPGRLFLKIRDHLDVSNQNSGWRALFAVLDGQYLLQNISEYEGVQSPTTKLLQVLAARGMTIEEFVNYAARAEVYMITELFNVFIPAEITQNPTAEMYVLSGDRVTMTVRAKGFPPPQYQWCKGCEAIEGSNCNTFQIDAASLDDSGEYCCVVYNSEDATLLKFSTCTRVTVQPAPELQIKEHPCSCTAVLNGNAVFKCEAWGGGENIQYQWYKDDRALNDGDQVKGSTQNELRLYRLESYVWVGCYKCVVKFRDQVVYSNDAVLQIEDLITTQRLRTNYTARDKVALLIGCSDYRGDRMLSAPKYDVQTLAGIFQSLQFKVVSLLNLTKVEMVTTVSAFREMVGPGVYCVFYFCGHGFESFSQCFLVPTDAPIAYQHTNCVSADKIFSSLLEKEPQICCMILDICRNWKEDGNRPALVDRSAVEKGNAIICYGTSCGLAAYEDLNCGILVSNLKKVLTLPYDFDTVFKMLRRQINSDPRVNKDGQGKEQLFKQIPEIRTNLLEVDRSFTDRIEYKGHTAEYNNRQLMWEFAHKKPDVMFCDVQFPGFTVKIRLDFQQEFSNVLKIYTSVVDPGPALECMAYINAIPSDVAQKEKVKIISSADGNNCRTYITINNIQKLKSNMKVKMLVKCLVAPDELEKEECLNLGLPLVAALRLWEERPEPNCVPDVEDEANEAEEGNCTEYVEEQEGAEYCQRMLVSNLAPEVTKPHTPV